MKKQKTINFYSCKCVLESKVSCLDGPPEIKDLVNESILPRKIYTLFKNQLTKFHLIKRLKLLATKLNLVTSVYKLTNKFIKSISNNKYKQIEISENTYKLNKILSLNANILGKISPDDNESIHEIITTALKSNINKFQNKLAIKPINLKVSFFNKINKHRKLKKAIYGFW